MPAPSRTSSTELARELNQYLANNASIRRQASNMIAQMAAGPTDAETILQVCEAAQANVNYCNKVAGLTGMPEYAAQTLTPTTTAAAFTSSLFDLRVALEAVVDEVTQTMPSHGYLDDPPIVNGERVLQTYTPAQTSELRADLQAVVDAIDP